ncbi:unnamed protein product [Paramecium sonneborni]|uniref:Cilia- and flagella-associated protein 299 n=1 Tax=Paramecium sonneborni TaxID=65129 RepID=A0A8S1QK63_9CILI|nr:unnamed protein product [Paramecium sonneborni]CAD8119086.1 unnamed protein product [Paramecium sonneborni]
MMIAEDFDSEVYDTSLDKFKTYEEYLDSHITKEDLFYLEDIELARQLKEQGYHAKTEILSREQFEAKKKAVEEARLNQNKDKTKALAHTEVSDPSIIEKSPFLRALAERELKVLNGKLLTIIFIRLESANCEVSGYIDYAHRLKSEDFKIYFEGKKKLQPRPTDLSYYNWRTGQCVSNDSPNFKVDANSGQQGLLFRNKRDRKVINVDPNKKPEDGMTRTEIESPEAIQIVLYDYYTRKK